MKELIEKIRQNKTLTIIAIAVVGIIVLAIVF